MRIFFIVFIAAPLFFLKTVAADEVRHTEFKDKLQGFWARSADQCSAKDNSNIRIEKSTFNDSGRDCNVQWIVERAAARGTTYGLHARCVDPGQPEKAQIADYIIVSSPTGDQILVGKSFDELTSYQRCRFH